MNEAIKRSYAVLTIDDIPSCNTTTLVDYLNSKEIPVVMFAWGEHVLEHPDQVIYALQHGMIIGNHSYTHPHFSEISFEEGIKEIEKCEEVLDDIYKRAGVDRKYRPFRFPYGDKGGENKEKLQNYLLQKGFNKLDDRQITYPWWKERGLDKDIDTLWTFDFAEYQIREGSGFTLEDVFKRVNDMNPSSGGALLEEGSHHIILLHDHDETRALVPEYYKLMLENISDKGVTFVKPEFV